MSTPATNPASTPADIPTAEFAASPRFSRGWFAMGLTLMLIGGVWLLASLGYLPEINWFWVLALFSLGLIPLLAGGLNKVTFISGGFFFAASVSSVLRQTGKIALNVEVPTLIIIAGLLTLIAMVLRIRTPAWLLPQKPIAYRVPNTNPTSKVQSAVAA